VNCPLINNTEEGLSFTDELWSPLKSIDGENQYTIKDK